MILITGCGRSGTKYMALVLQACGLDIGHERMGRDGIVSSLWAVKADHYPPYHCPGPQPEFDLILHQVRNPLDTIGSGLTAVGASWDYLARHIPISKGDPLAKKCAEWWYWWNMRAEERADWTYQIETIPDLWGRFTALLGIDADYKDIEEISKKTHSRKHPTITWDDVERATPLYPRILGMAKEYGYN